MATMAAGWQGHGQWQGMRTRNRGPQSGPHSQAMALLAELKRLTKNMSESERGKMPSRLGVIPDNLTAYRQHRNPLFL
jgi:hypothetical protein